MKLKITNKPDGSGYIVEFTTDDNVKIIDRWQVTTIEFENFCWQTGQFKGRYEDETLTTKGAYEKALKDIIVRYWEGVGEERNLKFSILKHHKG